VLLGSSGSTPTGLFAQIVGPDSAANDALNAQVNALQLLEAAIGVATTGHAVNAQSVSLSFPSSSNPLITLTSATSVIEPPSVAVGGVGATAYTAQIRTFIDITTPTTGSSLLGGLINLNLNLPIAIDLANAQAELTSLCGPGTPEATIAVTSSVLKMCVGDITEANAFSTASSCDLIPGAGTAQPVFKLTAAGVNLASLSTAFATNALTGNSSVTLTPGTSAVTGDSLNIGTSVSNLVTALTAALIANSSAQTGSTSSTGTANQTATDLWNGTNTQSSNLQRTQQALNEIQSASQGLQGTLGNVTTNVTFLLGNAVQLNVTGLLSDVGSLLNGVGTAVSTILNDVVCAGGLTSACITVISNAMSGGGTGTSSNAFVGLISFLLQSLEGPLNGIGSNVLTPLLSTTGLQLGENTVNLQSLQCHNVQLVY
jgi:uncharacterized membrane protein